jgi:mRNA-degrading endonuclease RelE of RelBE toxin-antitoxin system
MKIRLTDRSAYQYARLPKSIQRKADRQFDYLSSDLRHPSLHAKKYQGHNNLWQARIDRSWRFYFHIIEPDEVVVSIIQHP